MARAVSRSPARRLVLCRGDRFSGKERLIDEQPAQRAVGQDAVARFEQHHVSRRAARRRHAAARAIAQHARLRRDHARRMASAFSALPSWMKPTNAFTRTTATIAPASIACPRIAAPSAEASRK